MDFTQLGRTGLKVSRIVLGTMNFGPHTSVEDSHSIMDAAHEKGINFFDTANGYGRAISPGRTEEIIGEWFAKDPKNREKTVLATKVYGDMGDGWPNEGKLSALNIRRALDASLKRLQTDYVDLYQFHHVDRATPWDEIWQAIEVAIQQGKILYAGSSNFAGWHIAQAQAAAEKRNFIGLVSEQSIYNLIVRDVEREVLPAAQEFGLGVIPWSPLQGGLLGGVIRKENEGVRRLEGRAKETVEKLRPQIEQYEAFADELGVAPGELALAWLLHQPAVTGPIVGPRTMEQLDSAVRAVEVRLDEKALARLDEIFPGYKTAPEDYAW
ncbi:aryl-alcohol dehydrogenase-like predicted oxidoreductase [Kribbella sp. VKM Ac-2527]|uniref:Aryl-alcohol dehydrogenase-like predicted oxidoreductase n=1 Tax=Kribbella caucasensis TaxID=2512215 RepID=A0A4R6IXL6_9ACTN|nr:aldo/keto reductase [Kribbella sp. VKM Ac-2527]TDO27493.1 aryl-alcohol dehydrogenase-like predicted oxidoreductase [Kribbella sp. VKM Ac-2527]